MITLLVGLIAWMMGASCLALFAGMIGYVAALFSLAFVCVGLFVVGLFRRPNNWLSSDSLAMWFDNLWIGWGVVWGVWAIFWFVTTTDTQMVDARHKITFGYSTPNPTALPVEQVKTEIRRYKLEGMTTPKHFYVDLVDVATSDVYPHTYVSKHCNNHRDNQLGSEYNLSVTHYKQGEKRWITFNNLYGSFC